LPEQALLSIKVQKIFYLNGEQFACEWPNFCELLNTFWVWVKDKGKDLTVLVRLFPESP
jgi:hypothetical protein